MRQPPPVEADSRGILNPELLRRRVRFERFAAPEALAGLIDRLWGVVWELPDGVSHIQRLVTHPCVNISVGHADASLAEAMAPVPDVPIQAVVSGVARSRTDRTLAGSGWAIAAMTTPGGFGAWHRDVSALTDRVLPLSDVLEVDAEQLVRQITDAGNQQDRATVLGAMLTGTLLADRATAARQVAAASALPARDRSLRQAADLAAAAGVSVRTLQRLYADHAGVSPTWVLRRYRVLEAAELVRDGRRVVWAQTATDLGYSDQAHLIRDFRAATGSTPQAYADRQAALRRR